MHRVQPYREENLVVRRTMQRGRGSHPMAKSDIEKDAPKSWRGVVRPFRAASGLNAPVQLEHSLRFATPHQRSSNKARKNDS
jgi:hypothetical protein